MPTLVAGFGCRQGCPAEALGALLDQTLRAHGLQHMPLAAIASLDRKADEPGLLQLAAQRGVPLCTFSAAHLAAQEPYLSHRSQTSFAHTGCQGVAESSALALAQALGDARPRLLVERQHCAQATLALCQVGVT